MLFNRIGLLLKSTKFNHRAIPQKRPELIRNVQDELELLNRARALDPEALEEIHNTYYVPIFRYIAVRINDHATAEDLASEVFTRLLSALRDTTAPTNTIRGWLFGVASRIVKDYYRKQYRRPQTELSENLPSNLGDPVSEFEEKITQENLREAITTLTEEQQNVIALRFGYEMSIRDVAETLGKSEGSIKMLQARAIAALTRQMNQGRDTDEREV